MNFNNERSFENCSCWHNTAFPFPIPFWISFVFLFHFFFGYSKPRIKHKSMARNEFISQQERDRVTESGREKKQGNPFKKFKQTRDLFINYKMKQTRSNIKFCYIFRFCWMSNWMTLYHHKHYCCCIPGGMGV